MKRALIAVIGLAAAGAWQVPSAVASVITVTNIAMPYQETLTVGSPLPSAEGGYIGQLVLTTSTGQTIDAWCIDLFHDASLGAQSANFDYQIEPILTNNDPSYAAGAALSTAQINEISGLVVYGDNLLAAGGSSATLDQDSAAVQLAIWTVEYATPSSPFEYWDYPSGAAPTSLVNQTNELVTEAEAGDFTGAAEEMEGLDGQQSYAVAVPQIGGNNEAVPEPGSLALFTVALAGLLPLRRRLENTLNRHGRA